MDVCTLLERSGDLMEDDFETSLTTLNLGNKRGHGCGENPMNRMVVGNPLPSHGYHSIRVLKYFGKRGRDVAVGIRGHSNAWIALAWAMSGGFENPQNVLF